MFIRHSFQNSSLVFTEKKELLSPILCGVCFLSALTFAPFCLCQYVCVVLKVGPV